MRWIVLVLTAINSIKEILDLLSNFFEKIKREKEKEQMEKLKAETDKSIEEGNIDDLNDKLKF